MMARICRSSSTTSILPGSDEAEAHSDSIWIHPFSSPPGEGNITLFSSSHREWLPCPTVVDHIEDQQSYGARCHPRRWCNLAAAGGLSTRAGPTCGPPG